MASPQLHRAQQNRPSVQQRPHESSPTRQAQTIAAQYGAHDIQAAVMNAEQASPAHLLEIQRLYGNRAVQSLLSAGATGDGSRTIARASRPGSREGGALDSRSQSQIDSARGGGSPLDANASAQIGGALGADFSGVKVHTDPQADALNRSLSAKAFTTGSDIFFSQGAYQPGSSSGKQLLAHELTHVVQQGSAKPNKLQARFAAGAASAPPDKLNKRSAVQTKLTVGAANDRYEQEADRVARQIAAAPQPQTEGPLLGAQRNFAEQRLQMDPTAPGSQPILVEAGAAITIQREYDLGSGLYGFSAQEPNPADTPEYKWRPAKALLAKGPKSKYLEDHPDAKIDKVFERVNNVPAKVGNGLPNAGPNLEVIKSRAWSTKKSELGDGVLFKPIAKGTFEYVAQYLFASLEESSEVKESRRQELYEYDEAQNVWKAKSLSDDAKKLLLTEWMGKSLQMYDDPLLAKQGVGKMSPAEIQGAAAEKNVTAPESVQAGPTAVAIGFHGTNQPMRVVAGDKDADVSRSTQKGWGGLKSPKELEFKQKEYALNEKWNPLKDQLGKGAHFRKGTNWDNELLSTVSVATQATPTIKFPFPESAPDPIVTYVYAVVVEQAYPTFKIQKEIFPEMAVDKIDPDDIIGSASFDKYYEPAKIQQTGKGVGYTPKDKAVKNNEVFAYLRGRFLSNSRFKRKWGKNADAIITKAAQVLQNELGNDYAYGIYDSMKITK